nr:ABC transporter permease subunit [Anaerolineales bacterium]
GMGRLFLLALGESDYPVAMAMLLITAVLTVAATLVADLLYTAVDPRIRLT